MGEEHPERRLKRLLYRSRYRGTHEIDLLLGRFAERHLGGFTDEQLARFAALLDCADDDLFAWISGQRTPPPECDHDVMKLLQDFKYTP